MRCPYCGGLETQVRDSRPTEDNTAIRRRRICPDCGGRFTTFEREKLEKSVSVALRKRPVDNERVERMLNGIVRQLESVGEGDITSETIGEMVMEGLKQIDDVAYVRFASVYRNFREAKDFENALAELSHEGEPRADDAEPAVEKARARPTTPRSGE